jgi:hypothetical protein
MSSNQRPRKMRRAAASMDDGGTFVQYVWDVISGIFAKYKTHVFLDGTLDGTVNVPGKSISKNSKLPFHRVCIRLTATDRIRCM